MESEEITRRENEILQRSLDKMAYARMQEIEDQINKLWADIKGCVQKVETISKGNGVGLARNPSQVATKDRLLHNCLSDDETTGYILVARSLSLEMTKADTERLLNT
jgi:peptide deformylase